MSKNNDYSPEEEDDSGISFEESVRRFAEAFFALSDEEKEELYEYTAGRCREAEEEYKKRNGKK